jgi:hypothetical protein
MPSILGDVNHIYICHTSINIKPILETSTTNIGNRLMSINVGFESCIFLDVYCVNILSFVNIYHDRYVELLGHIHLPDGEPTSAIFINYVLVSGWPRRNTATDCCVLGLPHIKHKNVDFSKI